MIPINQNDLLILNKNYHSINSSFHFIYGSHLSGKTNFIRDFVVKKNYIYFHSSLMNKNLLFSNFTQIINKKFKITNSLYLSDTFEKILLLLSEQDFKDKLVVIFDNFITLTKIEKNAIEILLKDWNNKLKKKHIQLIVINSSLYEDSINKKILKVTNHNIYMEKFSFDNIPSKSSITKLDRLYIYAILGSSNHLLSMYNIKLDFIKNIYKIALVPTSPFFNYGFDYLKKN